MESKMIPWIVIRIRANCKHKIADEDDWQEKKMECSTASRVFCDFSARKSIILVQVILMLISSSIEAIVSPASQQTTRGSNLNSEHKLFNQVDEQAQLPCLIGKQEFCGDPYFIAWYKFNSTSRAWLRFDYKTLDSNNNNDFQADLIESSDSSVSRSFNERVKFVWSRSSADQRAKLAPAKSAVCNQQYSSASGDFDCAYLSINSLELADEGQYKCEITFSETLDFEKCPATTLSQLNVIGK